MPDHLRFPDFIIIGAMKSATSSLYRWLADQPDVFLASPKETDFFSRDSLWNRGTGWYAALFETASSGQRAGEASVSYSSPGYCEVVAQRIIATCPNARLIYVVRHPVDRIRSHYRHEVQRGRERRTLAKALRESASLYIGHSLYYQCLRPFIELFPRQQICVVGFDDLVNNPFRGWRAVTDFLGLPPRATSGTAYNVTTSHARWTRPMRWIVRSGVGRVVGRSQLPVSIRAAGRIVLTRNNPGYQTQLLESMEPIPHELERKVWDDVAHLESWLRLEKPLWPSPAQAARNGARSTIEPGTKK